MNQQLHIIIRAETAGCFFGLLIKEGSEEGQHYVVLNNCRRLWHWDGAASLSELAVNGTNKPQYCKFSVETNNHTIFRVIEIIPTSEDAQNSINGVKAWRA